jgi:hypothetical protein
MSVPEVVAILGAHSLGRAQLKNSGIDGGWTSVQSSFSNQYYKDMGNIFWGNNNKSDVWVNGPRATMLLKCDAELLFQTSGNGRFCSRFNSFTPTNNCPIQTESYDSFMSFESSNAKFFSVFSTAWQKMTESGGTMLAEVGSFSSANYPVSIPGVVRDQKDCEPIRTLLGAEASALVRKYSVCEQDHDCDLLSDRLDCWGSCPRSINLSNETAYEEAIAELNAIYCQTGYAKVCGYLTPDCMMQSAVCRDGKCGVSFETPAPTPSSRCRAKR